MSRDFLNDLNAATPLLTLIATATIPAIVHYFTKRITTLQTLSAVRSQVAVADLEITRLMGVPDKIGEAELDAIDRNLELRAHVVSLLNIYEELAQATMNKMIDKRLVKQARGSMLYATFDRFEPFIMRWRTKENASSAWMNLESLAKSWKSLTRFTPLPLGSRVV